MEYQCDGFLHKNRDTVMEEQIAILKETELIPSGVLLCFFRPWEAPVPVSDCSDLGPFIFNRFTPERIPAPVWQKKAKNE